MVILKWYSVFVLSLLLLSLMIDKESETFTVVAGGFIFLPILAYIIMG